MMKRTALSRLTACAIAVALAVGLTLTIMPASATVGRTENATIVGLWNLTWKDIAADGDVLVIGAPLQDTSDGWAAGAVFVYRWDGFAWQHEQTLAASNAGNELLFGDDVDVDGDVIVVSRAPGGAYLGPPGSAYIFTFDGSSWTEVHRIDAPTGTEEAFGRSIAVSGDRLAVGVTPAHWPSAAATAIRTYRFDATSVTFESEIPGPLPSPSWFGMHVALHGDTLVSSDGVADDWAGKAFIFDWDGSDWTETGRFDGYSEGAQTGDELGSVAISGDVAVAGGACISCSSGGHAYVYGRAGAGWVLEATLAASDTTSGNYFGGAVDMANGTVIVSAEGLDQDRGAAYVFEESASIWSESAKLVASDGASQDYFGMAAVAEDTYVVVGYENDDAYVYLRSTASGVDRLAGADRYETAAAISASTFDPGVSAAYVATGDNFPDALTAGPLAGRTDGPILLTGTDAIPSATAAELVRLQPKSIVILGGSGVVSNAVATALESYTAGIVTRLAGADRYATAAAISQATFSSAPPVAYIAVGTDFPDALAGGPLAALTDGPILLTQEESIPWATAMELTRLDPDSIVILGGSGAVSATVEALLGAYTDGTVSRLDGPDRYSTAAEICEHGFGSSPTEVFIAVGTDFPDALAGVPAAALRGAPILLTQTESLPKATADELTRLQPQAITILGGTGVVSTGVEWQLASYLAP